MAIATALMSQIKDRKLHVLFTKEDQILSKGASAVVLLGSLVACVYVCGC